MRNGFSDLKHALDAARAAINGMESGETVAHFVLEKLLCNKGHMKVNDTADGSHQMGITRGLKRWLSKIFFFVCFSLVFRNF